MQTKSIASILRKIVKVNFILSARVNFKHFGIKGLLKMPIIIEYGSKFKCHSKDSIVFLQPLKPNMLSINYGNSIKVAKGGKIIFSGSNACFNYKNSVLVSSTGVMEIGENFTANGEAEFNCRKGLKFGDNVLISVHVMFLDTDYHYIYNDEGTQINQDRAIVIGNNVWIGCNVTILKGAVIGNGIIVGATSLVTGKLLEDNSIYSGNPIKPVKSGISWQR
jgi:acetyltransferase-like isoleucine patch superfamily enzyme